MVPAMVARGGGVKDLKVRVLRDGAGRGPVEMLVLDVYINVCESMGANAVNNIVEVWGRS